MHVERALAFASSFEQQEAAQFLWAELQLPDTSPGDTQTVVTAAVSKFEEAEDIVACVASMSRNMGQQDGDARLKLQELVRTLKEVHNLNSSVTHP